MQNLEKAMRDAKRATYKVHTAEQNAAAASHASAADLNDQLLWIAVEPFWSNIAADWQAVVAAEKNIEAEWRKATLSTQELDVPTRNTNILAAAWLGSAWHDVANAWRHAAPASQTNNVTRNSVTAAGRKAIAAGHAAAVAEQNCSTWQRLAAAWQDAATAALDVVVVAQNSQDVDPAWKALINAWKDVAATWQRKAVEAQGGLLRVFENHAWKEIKKKMEVERTAILRDRESDLNLALMYLERSRRLQHRYLFLRKDVDHDREQFRLLSKELATAPLPTEDADRQIWVISPNQVTGRWIETNGRRAVKEANDEEGFWELGPYREIVFCAKGTENKPEPATHPPSPVNFTPPVSRRTRLADAHSSSDVVTSSGDNSPTHEL
ncbi:unnamed protein product, partial [Mesorhabditis spiculigera]